MSIRRTLAIATLAGALVAGTAFASGATSSAASPRDHGHATAHHSGTSTSSSSGTGSHTPSKSAPMLSTGSSSGTVAVDMVHRPGEAVAGTDSGNWASMYDLMQFVVQDTASVWNWYYGQWGKGTSSVHYYFSSPGEVVKSACNGPALSDDSSPFYCGADDTIYFSQVRAQKYWEASGGDFGVVAALAHEYGHNVQKELGLKDHPDDPSFYERYADCLSGAFAHVAYYQGILDANDIAEGRASREWVGDYEFTDPGHHGTPAERSAAFQLGYDGTGPAVCDSLPAGATG